MKKAIKKIKYDMSISMKLMSAFAVTLLLSFVVTMFTNNSISHRLENIEQVYTSNSKLNEISSALNGIQVSMREYLDTQSSESLTSYYSYDQIFGSLIDGLSDEISDKRSKIMEKNIKGLAKSYSTLTTEAIEAKRARDISKYKIKYDIATKIYNYLYTQIFSLNNVQFEVNSGNYKSLADGLRMLERITVLLNITVALINVLLLGLLIRQIIWPLRELSKMADRVADGDFTVPQLHIYSMDEVGIVTKAFNKMIINIRDYMEQIKDSLQNENRAKEKELLMEASLKEAQLKYYQAQIHPHFLFNTLNAGAQMAMMENAEGTYSFIQRMSAFFRYSMKNTDADVSLSDEIELVENYLYIMNARFSDEIQYRKNVQCDITNIRVPAMILQPIVENAIRYGIRDIEWPGIITLDIESSGPYYVIRIEDNGAGIERQRLEDIRAGKIQAVEKEDDSNGIGLSNVMERLSLFYHQNDLMQIISEGEGKGTTVIIKIPQVLIKEC